MLSQFIVKNYKSIKEEAIFDMQAAAISEHADRIIRDTDGQTYLPVSAIYGPNGGGKSNVLEAMHTLKSRVISPIIAAGSSNEHVKRLPVVPFRFDAECKNKPTEFEIYFRINKVEYRYILHVKNEKTVFESLDRIRLETGRRSSIFSRNENAVEMKGSFGRMKVSKDISDSLPLLSYLGISYRNNDTINEVINWFENGIEFLNYGNPWSEIRTAVSIDGEVRKLMLDMIKEMDLDIEDYRVDTIDDNQIEIYTKHVVDGVDTELTLADESSGTKKIFGLLPYIASALLQGSTLVIDELDAKIHPVLLRYLIMTFSNMSINKKGGQLIFTSHDLSTMNGDVFRRDEIWFVAKGASQNSHLYSLVEFKSQEGLAVRKDAKFDKQYLEGKYGADPYLRRIVNWEKINA